MKCKKPHELEDTCESAYLYECLLVPFEMKISCRMIHYTDLRNVALETRTSMVHLWRNQWPLSIPGILREWRMYLQQSTDEDNVSWQLSVCDSESENQSAQQCLHAGPTRTITQPCCWYQVLCIESSFNLLTIIRDSRKSQQKRWKTRHTFVKIAKIMAKSRQFI